MPKHILVINDTQEILELFREILTTEGYDVTLQAYGPQEIDDVRRLRPDLLIADFPPLDREQYGWQLVQKLKMSRDTELIPIVVCTTNLRAVESNQSWLATKGVVVVAKPFNIDELLQAVERQIGKVDSPELGPWSSQPPSQPDTQENNGQSVS